MDYHIEKFKLFLLFFPFWRSVITESNNAEADIQL